MLHVPLISFFLILSPEYFSVISVFTQIKKEKGGTAEKGV
jgi:hypothetical protein